MANDFSGDSNCRALWRFESGALTTDSKGSNTLTDNNTVGESTSAYKEGSCCADFERGNSEYLSITDANLDSGFPTKSGDTNKKISVCFWTRIESTTARDAMGKWDGSKSWKIYLDGSHGLRLYQSSDGSAEETAEHGTTMGTGTWYHVGVTYDDSDKSYRIRVWDDSAGAILGSDKTGNFTSNINIGDAPFLIGAAVSSTYWFDGLIDELAVFDRVLTTNEIDQIRAGTYSAAASAKRPAHQQIGQEYGQRYMN